jgi:DNA topoisomerase VI subunit B
MAVQLQRQVFEISRKAEFFTVRELQAQTGQLEENFGAMVLKELVDNALNACEIGGVTPEITMEVSGQHVISIVVADNGLALPLKTVQRVLNFATRTSDKAPGPRVGRAFPIPRPREAPAQPQATQKGIRPGHYNGPL